MSGRRCTVWSPARRRNSAGGIRKQTLISLGQKAGTPSPRDIMMSPWPWARLKVRAVCAERCPYGSGRRSAHALLTPLPIGQGFLYLVAIMDWASQGGAGMATVEYDGCVVLHRGALEEALARFGRPEIFNSDQGSQFTSLSSRPCSKVPAFKSPWTGAAAAWTTFSSSGCGAA